MKKYILLLLLVITFVSTSAFCNCKHIPGGIACHTHKSYSKHTHQSTSTSSSHISFGNFNFKNHMHGFKHTEKKLMKLFS